MPHRLPMGSLVSVCAAAAVVAGCSSAGGPASPSTSPPATVSPAATVPEGGTTPASPSPSSPARGLLAVAIGGLPAQPRLSLGGAPQEFTVSLRNATGHAYTDITAVVSLAHCTCSSSPAAFAPAGAMQERNPVTGRWRRVSYDTEGGGMDYIYVVEQPGFTLKPGATARFTFRLAFSPPARQTGKIHAGQTAIDVTVVQLPAHKRIGKLPAASVPLTVVPT